MSKKRGIRAWMTSASAAVLLAVGAGHAHAEIFDVGGKPLLFAGSGTGTGMVLNSTRTYSNVITIDGTRIDARVTIVGLDRATVTSFDSTSQPYSETNFFQPSVNISSAGGSVTFRIDFLDDKGAPATLQNFYINTYDLDGAGGNTAGRQFTDFSGFASYALASGSYIQLENVAGGTRFKTTVGGNFTDLPGTNEFNLIRARVLYTSASSVTVKLGDLGYTGTAYFGLDFSLGYEFNNIVDDTTPPVVTADQTFSYAENQVAGAKVATVAATDAIGVTQFRFAANSSQTSADGYYTIDNTGAVRLTAAGAAAGVSRNDFDILPNSFTYVIQAADAANNWSTPVSISLNVTAVAPTITGPSGGAGASASEISVNENQTAVTTVTANRPVSWSITGGADRAKFSIDATTGVITFVAAPDFEAPTDADTNNVYVLVVTATDAGSLTSTQTISVTVLDVPDNPPVISVPGGTPGAATQAVSVDENQTAVTTLTASPAVTWAISGGDDADRFTIVAATGALSFKVAPDFEAPTDADGDNVYQVKLAATGANGLVSYVTLNVTVLDVAEAKPVITGPSGGPGAAASGVSVSENQTAVTTLGANKTVAWAITGGDDAGKFDINASTGAITFKVAPDYEAPTDTDTDNVYVLVVTATDANNERSTQTVSVTVLDEPEPAPVITGPSGGAGAASSSIDVNENQTAVTTLTANGTVGWQITGGADAGKFNIDASSGTIIFKTAPDFEAPTDADTNNVYVLVVTATNADNETATHTVSVRVLNVSETLPVVTGPSGGAGAGVSAISVNENQTAVTQLSADRTVVWAISGGADASRFNIDAASGTITFKTAPDFEAPTDADTNNVYVLEVQATDANNEVATQTISVTVLNLPEPVPVLTGPSGGAGAAASAVSVNENQTAATSLSADRAVTWTITGGADAAKFVIDVTTGAISFVTAPDFENPTDADADNVYRLQVTATDANNETATQSVAVTVLDLPEPVPVLTGPSGGAGASASTVSVNENQTAVAGLSANRPVKWTISGGADAGKFTIDPSTGALTFITAPDFETPTDADKDNVYLVEITATDANNEIATQTIAVTVLDLVDTKPIITGPGGATVEGNLAIAVPEDQAEVTTLASSRPVNWQITGGDDRALFKIDSDGALSFIQAPDFEAPTDADANNVYVLEVTARDGNDLDAVVTVVVTVEDLDDTKPQITGPDGVAGATSSRISLPEGLTEVTTFTADEPVKWSLAGGSDEAFFAIDTATGELGFLDPQSYETPNDSDKNNTYIVVVRATDAFENASEHTLTVEITDVDEVGNRIAAIAYELRSDLRTYAFNSLGDMLSFNESVFRDIADCEASAAQGKLTPGMQLNEFNQGSSLDWAKTHCTARYRVIANAGAAITHNDGDWTRRGLASVRVETEVRQDLTLGLGLMGSFANNDLPSFADSSISDRTLQINGYVKARLAENLRAGAFAGFGRAWYDFDLQQTGFDLTGKMEGRRQVYGAMLSGDIEVRDVLLTTDIILSRATEDLGQARLIGTAGDETRKVMFAVGDVDMTRISIPVSGELNLWGNDPKGWQSSLRLSPGVLCEDTSASDSALTCGYQFGGRLMARKEHSGGGYIDYRFESVDRRTRNMIGVGYQYIFGRNDNLEWAVDVTGGVVEGRSDNRAMLTFRARQ
ncbi:MULTISPECIES: cadherin domain-containing protein [unclassified Brevundimonas]|uniref:cadherin domain-containing protein n=1 Tax=unclassified Brevundimonas TaxID=2622653 RepID=UPI0025BDEC69|nr:MULTISPECIES: cadherin domain-containing protein [unclassified Brevundimonas]